MSAIQNQYPLKKQTIKDVVERILLTAEPLVVERQPDNSVKYVKEPRFKFAYKYYDESKPYEENSQDGKNEFNLFNQTSPEFTFTRQTLREQMQKIGEYIHAEPRLLGDLKTFIFDRFGEQDRAVYTPEYVGVIERMLKDIEEGKIAEMEGKEKILNYLDSLILQGGHAKEYAERFYQNLRQEVRDEIAKKEQAIAQNDPEFAAVLAAVNTVQCAGFNTSMPEEPTPVEPKGN